MRVVDGKEQRAEWEHCDACSTAFARYEDGTLYASCQCGECVRSPDEKAMSTDIQHDKQWLTVEANYVIECNALITNSDLEDYAERYAEHLNAKLAARFAELEKDNAALKEALMADPFDPYPASIGSIKTEEQYAELVPDHETRTAISWYMAGSGYRNAMRNYGYLRDEFLAEMQPQEAEE